MTPEHIPTPTRSFADLDQLSVLVSGGDVEFFQLGSGPCKASMTRIDLDGFFSY